MTRRDRPGRTHLRRRAERGAATAFVVGMAVTLLSCAGLVVDGGTALNAKMKLADDVEQAARAGAQEIDQIALRQDGEVVVDEAAARSRATSYLTALGYTVTAFDADGATVSITATDVVDARVLTLIGVNDFDIEASATADAVTQ
ncbi:TadE/TadG family type IV pilus assembly protein [Nocardioides sp.]|uniref:TadE/TadG family type IV pilus assembly protein n=1 Tax=Nocardioides sp. TaxID=35761 RepID=UPI00271DF1C9|nr:pilus assembly protein TadG-related protein [Nocardioides sp.]MDO9454770.1 pilus assembly protein TadG-related protein [Nocardioides sp.]